MRGAQAADRRLFAKYFGAMLEHGVYFAPSPFESNFLCAAHTAAEIDRTVAASDAALADLRATDERPLRAMHLPGAAFGP